MSKISSNKETTSNDDIYHLQLKVASLGDELDAKIADIQLLRESMEKKDSILQDRSMVCDSLRAQLQQVENSERQLQLQLEELYQQEQRRRVDLEDNIEDLKRVCEDQSREILALKSFSTNTEETNGNSDGPPMTEAVTLSKEYLAQSEELRRKSDLLESQKTKYDSLKSNLRDKEDKLLQSEQDRKQLKSQLEDAARECERKCSLLNAELISVHSELKIAQEMSKNMKNQLETSEEARKRLEKENKEFVNREETLQTELRDSELKLKTLVDRTKDLMQKYAEQKAINSRLEAEKVSAANMASISSSKESELLSLRLKLENMERSSSDYKVKTTELAERFAEAQREIHRGQDRAKESSAKLAALQMDRDGLAEQLSSLQREREELKGRVNECSQLTTEREQRCEEELRACKQRCEQIERESQATIFGLEMQVSDLSERVKMEASTASVLDDYKKRAQLAIKKANRDVATLTAECSQLREQLSKLRVESDNKELEELREQLARSEYLRALADDSIKKMHVEMDQLRSKLKESEKQIRILEQQQTAAPPLYPHYSSPPPTVHVIASGEDVSQLRALQDEVRILQSQLEEQQQEREKQIEERVAAALAASSYNNNRKEPDERHRNDDKLAEVTLDEEPVYTDSWAIVASRQGQPLTPPTYSGSTAMNTGGEELDGVNVSTTAEGGISIFVNELQTQLEYLKKSLSLRGIDLEAALQELQMERVEKRKLESKVEELKAFLDRIKKLQDGPDSAINMEYLKNCVFKYMSSNELSEKKRLYPVICTILKLTHHERKMIEAVLLAIEEPGAVDINSTLNNITVFASSSLESLWGLWG
eukprot:CAMPEP_0170098556 /NCGR_PEP_ID=MMETSP0020_2-20130122/495_1 /TAXON_ID=98059 /ORGANISM="Dinobryon sp., Strain UTEXLB2267" /LENGTH=829 /DNA_ID=CAMNT_0010321007 /DNA_START=18 /DNA_END=2507 /DNA_ORIENTATION=-